LDLTLNSFETEAVKFFERVTNVIVVKFFIKVFTTRESNGCQTFDLMNSIKFRVSLLAKHWTYQTLNECISAAIVTLPIEKYKLKLIQALIFRAQTLLMSSSSLNLSTAREWNERHQEKFSQNNTKLPM